MNGHLDPYVPVSVPNGFRETASSGSSVSNYESLIDLSPPRCRAPSNPNAQDVVREGQASRTAYDSPSLTNGVLYRNSSEAATASRLPAHYWTGMHWLHMFSVILLLLARQLCYTKQVLFFCGVCFEHLLSIHAKTEKRYCHRLM